MCHQKQTLGTDCRPSTGNPVIKPSIKNLGTKTYVKIRSSWGVCLLTLPIKLGRSDRNTTVQPNLVSRHDQFSAVTRYKRCHRPFRHRFDRLGSEERSV